MILFVIVSIGMLVGGYYLGKLTGWNEAVEAGASGGLQWRTKPRTDKELTEAYEALLRSHDFEKEADQ